jgi:hypothetical protein
MGEIIGRNQKQASYRRPDRQKKAQAIGREGRTQGQIEGAVKDSKCVVNIKI